MGMWAPTPFGNDDALDWKYDLEDTNDLTFISDTLDKAVDGSASELAVSEKVFAAIDTVARLLGKGTGEDSYTDSLDAWIEQLQEKPDPLLIEKARKALSIIKTDSSFQDRFGKDEIFLQAVRQLEEALQE